jgi:predicted nucleotidyltransferase
VESLFLFGSYAQGNPHEYSDIDIAVFSPDVEKMSIEERAGLAAEAKMKIDSTIELHLFPAKALKEARPTNFYGYILKTGKRIG